MVDRFIDPNLLTLSNIKPIGGSSNSERFYQFISYNGKRKLLLETPEFYSEGPVASQFKVGVQQIPIPAVIMGEFFKVDDFCYSHFQLPAILEEKWRKAISAAIQSDSPQSSNNVQLFYKRLNPEGRIYVAIEEEASVFDKQRQLVTRKLGSGWYKCIVSARGVYIGQHGATSKLASLQLRIQQIMYTPLGDDGTGCLFLTEDAASDDTEPAINNSVEGKEGEPEKCPQLDEIWSILGPEIEKVVPGASVVPTPNASEAKPAIANGPVEAEDPVKKKRRKRKNPNLPPLIIPPHEKQAKIMEEGRSLMKEYKGLDYSTQDPTEEELKQRLSMRDEVNGKLIQLLGSDWEQKYYRDFVVECEMQLNNE